LTGVALLTNRQVTREASRKGVVVGSALFSMMMMMVVVVVVVVMGPYSALERIVHEHRILVR